MIRKGFIIFILFSIGFPKKINLNSTTIEEMQLLDLNNSQIESIIEYKNHTGNIHDIYELLQIPGITITNIHSKRNMRQWVRMRCEYFPVNINNGNLQFGCRLHYKITI